MSLVFRRMSLVGIVRNAETYERAKDLQHPVFQVTLPKTQLFPL